MTEDNRSDFVRRYTDWLLNKCIKKQFNAFLRGFELVTDESPLKTLFRPAQLEQLVCGEVNYDWDKLKGSGFITKLGYSYYEFRRALMDRPLKPNFSLHMKFLLKNRIEYKPFTRGRPL